jgi:hypothetical protein
LAKPRLSFFSGDSEKTKFYGEKKEGSGVPNNRVIPDQFLKKAVNQVGSAAGSEMSRDEKQYEAMIAEITRSNYQNYPL